MGKSKREKLPIAYLFRQWMIRHLSRAIVFAGIFILCCIVLVSQNRFDAMSYYLSTASNEPELLAAEETSPERTNFKEVSTLKEPPADQPKNDAEKSKEAISQSGSTESTKTAEGSTTKSPTISKKKWNVTACAMIYNEVAYTIEWIEFHRLQGVDHFVLYDYSSNDIPQYLNILYERINQSHLVQVEPVRFFNQRPDRLLTSADYAQNMEWSLGHCYNKYGTQSHWVLMAQVSHFVYTSYANRTVADTLMELMNETADGVDVPVVCFGTGGVERKFDTWITPNAFTGKVDIHYDNTLPNQKNFPLVIETNVRRAPHTDLDDSGREINVPREASLFCDQTSTVLAAKGGTCKVKSNIFECVREVLAAPMEELRADWHGWRSLQQMDNDISFNRSAKAEAQILDTTWYSTVPDLYKSDRFSGMIRENIQKLEPVIFIEVDRECIPAALANGQQVMCPKTHPYPFGYAGVDYLRQCCETDKDKSGKPLSVNSTSCFDNKVKACEDPKGMASWSHRSCCIWNDQFVNKTR